MCRRKLISWLWLLCGTQIQIKEKKKPLWRIFWHLITIWQEQLGKICCIFSCPLVPPTQGVSIHLAPVTTCHHYIIRACRFSYIMYVDIGRYICASETIHPCLFVFNITSHNMNLLLGIMTNDLFSFNVDLVRSFSICQRAKFPLITEWYLAFFVWSWNTSCPNDLQAKDHELIGMSLTQSHKLVLVFTLPKHCQTHILVMSF